MISRALERAVSGWVEECLGGRFGWGPVTPRPHRDPLLNAETESGRPGRDPPAAGARYGPRSRPDPGVSGPVTPGSGGLYPVLLLELGLTVGVVAVWEVARRVRRGGPAVVEAPAAESDGPWRARSFLRAALGLAWVLDGLLQA